MRILITGSKGQLAYDLRLAFKDHKVTSFNKDAFDLTNHRQCKIQIDEVNPQLIINTAAYHNTDVAEEEASMAFRVNAKGVENLAKICAMKRIKLIHISTDYVFGGYGSHIYAEDSPVCPINVYGASKALGEQLINQAMDPDQFIICRTSALFGVAGPSAKKHNFIDLMIKLASEGTPLKVVNDQQFSPTYTKHLAQWLLKCVDSHIAGVIHLTNKGFCTWQELAQYAITKSGLDVKVASQSTKESGAKALRPKSSILSNRVDVEQVDWKDAVDEYLIDKKKYQLGEYNLEVIK